MLCAASCMLYRERTQPTRSAAFSIGPLARNGRTNWIVPHSPTWNKTGRVKSTLSRTEMAHTPVLTRTVSGNTFGLCASVALQRCSGNYKQRPTRPDLVNSVGCDDAELHHTLARLADRVGLSCANLGNRLQQAKAYRNNTVGWLVYCCPAANLAR